jgi:hypothetical protein
MPRNAPRHSREKHAEPSPARESADPTPRDRVLAHLDTLLRGATAVGTGVLLGWASRADAQRPPQVCDPLPPPVNCKAPDRFEAGRCLAQQTRWTSVKGKMGVDLTIWLLQIGQSPWEAFPALSEPPLPDMLAPGEPALPVSFTRVARRDVAVDGAVAESVTIVSNRIDMRLRPPRGAKSVRVSLPDPSNRKKRITVVLDISKAAKEGLLVPARLVPEPR